MSDTKTPGRDRSHRWANLIVGFCSPRRWWRQLSAKRYAAAIKYVAAVWASANDNHVPAAQLKRPDWFPRRYLWPDKPRKF